LAAVRKKCRKGTPSGFKEMKQVDLGAWSFNSTAWKDLQDISEAQALSLVLEKSNRDQLPHAVDIISQPIREVLLAKKSGGTWEKGFLVGLLPCDQPAPMSMPDGAMAL
jgi:hypothetical protein